MDIPSPVDAVDDNIISKLESTFGESLHIEDAQKLEHVSEGDDVDNCHVGEGSLCGAFEQQETKLQMKCLENCSTFPYADMMLPSSSSGGEVDTSLTESISKESPHQSYPCSVSLPEKRTVYLIRPAPPKLVSAMKGNREKQGRSQMKLTVKWAPDVYDPVPTLLSHTVKSKKHQKSRIKKSVKKNGKKGHKVNYSKRGSVKDKQQYRNRWPESSDLRWLESSDSMIETCTELDDLVVVSHDSYHGTGYFKKPVTESHCHVGEALSNILECVSYIKTA
ncbi:hypothetical protein SESBI_36755 [Sesbania bispinosa]|nr:hypothetical protein SESBI_36755 [Sesbania bispinosa]